MVLFLLSVCMINYLDRVAISYAVEPIKAYFSLDNAGFGLCMSIFAFGALVINALAGYLADNINSKLLLGIG